MANQTYRRPLSIAYIVGSFPHVTETFIINQIAGMAARGHTVDIFTTLDRMSNDTPFVLARSGLMQCTHQIYKPRNRFIQFLELIGLTLAFGWRAPDVLFRAFRTMREEGLRGSIRLLYATLTIIRHRTRRYDVIHAQFGVFGLLAQHLVDTGALSGAVVTSFRGHDATQYVRENPGCYSVLFRKGRLFLPVSRSLAARLIEVGCDPGKVRVHHSGIDCTKFNYVEPRRQPGGSTKIMSIGRLVEAKGFAYSIQAVARLIASGSAVSYCIVGEGPLRDDLKHLIRELGAEVDIQLGGWKTHEEIMRLIEETHILIVPSITAADGTEEGIPNVLKEAMAMGRPVVGTVHAGIPELIEDGVSGFLVPERDAGALAERVAYLIDHPETWAKLGRAARQRVEAKFDIDRLNDELAMLYEYVSSPNERSQPQSEEALSLAREQPDVGNSASPSARD